MSEIMVPTPSPSPSDNLTIDELASRIEIIREAKKAVLGPEDYAHIGGTARPCLLKPGAEKLCQLFQLRAVFSPQLVYDGDHLTVTVSCALQHVRTGQCWGVADGMASTKETKWAFRWIPNGAAAPFGATLPEGVKARKVEGRWMQCVRGPNPDLPDLWNTVLKMAEKRSFVAATLLATAASGLFTQDTDDTTTTTAPTTTTTAPTTTTSAPTGPTADPLPPCPKCGSADTIVSKFPANGTHFCKKKSCWEGFTPNFPDSSIAEDAAENQYYQEMDRDVYALKDGRK